MGGFIYFYLFIFLIWGQGNSRDNSIEPQRLTTDRQHTRRQSSMPRAQPIADRQPGFSGVFPPFSNLLTTRKNHSDTWMDGKRPLFFLRIPGIRDLIHPKTLVWQGKPTFSCTICAEFKISYNPWVKLEGIIPVIHFEFWLHNG